MKLQKDLGIFNENVLTIHANTHTSAHTQTHRHPSYFFVVSLFISLSLDRPPLPRITLLWQWWNNSLFPQREDQCKWRCSDKNKEILVSQIKTLNIPRHRRHFVDFLQFLPTALGWANFMALKHNCKIARNNLFSHESYENQLRLSLHTLQSVYHSKQQDWMWLTVRCTAP